MFLSFLLLAVPAFGAALQNTDFDVSDPQSPRFGWSAPFSVSITNGQAVMAEDGVHLPVRLTQQFDLGTNVTQIQIIIEALSLGTNTAGQPPDAFQISLLDTNSASLVPVTPQTNTTAFFSAQQDGTVHYGGTTIVPGATGSGASWTPAFPVAIALNLTNRSSNVAAVLSFDLLGFDRVASGVVISRIRMIGLEPAAVADGVVLNEDATVTIAALTNDVPGAGQTLDPASLCLITLPTNGVITGISTNGVVSYRPATNFHGTDSFTYTIADFAGNRSGTATVSIAVSPVNDAPVLDAAKAPALSAVNEDAGAPAGAVGTLVSALLDFVTPAGGLDNVTDADSGAALGLAVIGKTAAGQVWYSTNNGTTWAPAPAVSAASALLLAGDTQTRLYYQPAANFNGAVGDVITFAAWDRSAGASGATGVDASTRGGAAAFSETTDVVAITVLSVNDPPVVANDTFAMVEDGLLNATSVLANDSDLHGGAPGENNTPLTALLASSTANGILVFNPDGTFSYRPNTNFNGTDTFTYRARDSLGGTSAVATVTINVSAVNDPPVVLVPGPTNVFRMTPTALRGIALADADAGAGNLTLALSVRNGTLQLATNIPGGVTVAQVASNGQATVLVTAPLAALNTTLAATNGLWYTGLLAGSDTLELLLNDNGNSGSGGAKTASASLGITVAGDAKDAWRALYFSPADLANPAKEATVWGDTADPDGDGRNNLSEYTAGTVPTNAASKLEFRVERAPGGPRFRIIPRVALRNYLVLASASPLSGYAPLVNPTVATNGSELVVTDTRPGAGIRYYRLLVNYSLWNSTLQLQSPATATVPVQGSVALRPVALTTGDVANEVMLVISATNGTLAVATDMAGGVTASQVIGNGAGAVAIIAPAAAINATLAAADGLVYTGVTAGVDTVRYSHYSAGAATVVTVTGGGLAAWRALYFSPADLANPAKEATVWGDAADPDGDGQNNLLEYVADTNPTNAISKLQLRVERVPGAPDRCRMRVTPGFVAGRTYTLVGSATAASGYTPIANVATQTNGTERIITDLSAPVPSVRFYRLRVSVP